MYLIIKLYDKHVLRTFLFLKMSDHYNLRPWPTQTLAISTTEVSQVQVSEGPGPMLSELAVPMPTQARVPLAGCALLVEAGWSQAL